MKCILWLKYSVKKINGTIISDQLGEITGLLYRKIYICIVLLYGFFVRRDYIRLLARCSKRQLN